MTDPVDELAAALKRTELQRSASSIPGREIVQTLTEIPAGVESGWHQHPGEEAGYIVAGTGRLESAGRSELLRQPVQGFLITPPPPHNTLHLGPETSRKLSTYIGETREPIT